MYFWFFETDIFCTGCKKLDIDVELKPSVKKDSIIQRTFVCKTEKMTVDWLLDCFSNNCFLTVSHQGTDTAQKDVVGMGREVKANLSFLTTAHKWFNLFPAAVKVRGDRI